MCINISNAKEQRAKKGYPMLYVLSMPGQDRSHLVSNVQADIAS